MAAFEYEALTIGGKTQKGTLEADNLRSARSMLREQNLIPVQVSEIIANKQGSELQFKGRISISGMELALVTRQLATLISASLPLEEALLSISQKSERKKVRILLSAVRAKVVEGHSFATALGLYPSVFSDLFRATVNAGEQAGFLGVVLERLADYTENRQHIKSVILKAVIYPIILTLAAIIIVAVLLTFVMPTAVEMFSSSDKALPTITQVLIGISNFIKSYGLLVLVAMTAAIVSFRIALSKNEDLLYRWQAIFLKFPIVAKLIKSLQSARFMRTFSILSGSGVPILQSLAISGEVISYLPMKYAVRDAALRIKEGAGIASSLEKSRLFPDLALQLVASGEASGKLEYMLERAASSQEKESEMRIGILLSIFEPMLILIMASIILMIVIAIILPIIQLTDLV